jgi:hypothetical protein
MLLLGQDPGFVNPQSPTKAGQTELTAAIENSEMNNSKETIHTQNF